MSDDKRYWSIGGEWVFRRAWKSPHGLCKDGREHLCPLQGTEHIVPDDCQIGQPYYVLKEGVNEPEIKLSADPEESTFADVCNNPDCGPCKASAEWRKEISKRP